MRLHSSLKGIQRQSEMNTNPNLNPKIIKRTAFRVTGKSTWISGQDNSLFDRFWQECQQQGIFDQFNKVNGLQPGPHTGGVTLGVSRVEQDPAKRAFYYMVAVENPQNIVIPGLETYLVPASEWAVFACLGPVPEAIVRAEIYAFMTWLPNSEFDHALAPEMEVYPPGPDGRREDAYNEFWLPVRKKTA